MISLDASSIRVGCDFLLWLFHLRAEAIVQSQSKAVASAFCFRSPRSCIINPLATNEQRTTNHWHWTHGGAAVRLAECQGIRKVVIQLKFNWSASKWRNLGNECFI